MKIFNLLEINYEQFFFKLHYHAINICHGSGSLSPLHMHNGSKITLTNVKPVIKKVIFDYIYYSFIILVYYNVP